MGLWKILWFTRLVQQILCGHGWRPQVLRNTSSPPPRSLPPFSPQSLETLVLQHNFSMFSLETLLSDQSWFYTLSTWNCMQQFIGIPFAIGLQFHFCFHRGIISPLHQAIHWDWIWTCSPFLFSDYWASLLHSLYSQHFLKPYRLCKCWGIHRMEMFREAVGIMGVQGTQARPINSFQHI